MTINISHIVVIGCSLSYGQGLNNIKQDSWAGVLAKKLNVPIVNLSTRGGGNDRIMRRLFEYHALDSNNDNNPLYVIAFSHSSRREEYFVELNNYSVVDMHEALEGATPENFSFPCVHNYDSFISARKKLMIRSYILDFFKANDTKYLVTDFMPDHEDELEQLSTLYPKPYEKIYSDKFRLEDLREISIKYPRLPCGHDDVEANSEIANYVYDELIARHGSANVTDMKFATLKDYIDHYQIVGATGDIDWL